MKTKSERPLIGVSACLLGEKVRFDGGHFNDRFVSHHLAKHVDFYPICPEMAMGLTAPREIMRVVFDPETGERKLVETKSGVDHTESIHEASKKILDRLPKELDGFILARKSPSCGVITAKQYNMKSKAAERKGSGLFAEHLLNLEADFPIIDSGLLYEDHYKDLFLKQVFAHFHLKGRESTSEIQEFHKNYKYLLMEHDPASVKKLGLIAANCEKTDIVEEYTSQFMAALKNHKPNKGKRVNVFMHLLGYFKKDFSDIEKKIILDRIDDYKNHQLTYRTLVEVFDLYSQGKDKSYLKEQVLFNPYPKELSPITLR